MEDYNYLETIYQSKSDSTNKPKMIYSCISNRTFQYFPQLIEITPNSDIYPTHYSLSFCFIGLELTKLAVLGPL